MALKVSADLLSALMNIHGMGSFKGMTDKGTWSMRMIYSQPCLVTGIDSHMRAKDIHDGKIKLRGLCMVQPYSGRAGGFHRCRQYPGFPLVPIAH